MIEGWPERIQAAQRHTHLLNSGLPLPRIPYGNEQDDWGAEDHPCEDCRVMKGELHVPGCDGEECPSCHGQLITCDCDTDNTLAS